MNKLASVVVLHDQASDIIILTKRNLALRHHPGEICFPGGLYEQGDADFWSTALRELHEELGIGANRVKLVKPLNIETTRVGTIIHPWFATIATINPYRLNRNEVSALITVPLQAAKLGSNYQYNTLDISGQRIYSCQFMATNHCIWGATARIMQQLCAT